MKRILSYLSTFLAAAVFMTGAFSLRSQDALQSTTPAAVTVVLGPVRQDQTFDVKIYVQDFTEYGFTDFGVELDWNATKVEPVTEQAEPGAIRILPLRRFVSMAEKEAWCESYMATQTSDIMEGADISDSFAGSSEPGGLCKIAYGSDSRGLGFSRAYIEKWLKTDAEAFDYSDEYGFLFAQAVFRVKEDAGGVAGFSASVYTALQANDGSKQPGFTDVKTLCKPGQAELRLDNRVSLAVLQGASVRFTEPTGLRFTCTAEAEDFAAISELGTEISYGSERLRIPATVFLSGDPNSSEKGGKVTYTGVLTHIKTSHVAARFTARAYAVVNGVTVYSESDYTASLKETASAALRDPYAAIAENNQALAVLKELSGS